MKRNTYLYKVLIGAVAATTLLSSCQSEDFGFTKQEVRRTKYDRDFAATFGQPQEGHQWGFDQEFYTGSTTRASNDTPDLITNGEIQNFRIMCEDMGDVNSDFDFNDVVFDVSYNGTDCKVTLQAIGGTLPIMLCYNRQPLSVDGESELHTAFAAESGKPVNVGAKDGAEPGKKSISVAVDPASFSAKKFSILVARNPKAPTETTPSAWYEVSAGGSSPLCICVPVTTAWCKEGMRIDKAYGNFKDWVQNEKMDDWTPTDATKLCDNVDPDTVDGCYSNTDDWNLAPRR